MFVFCGISNPFNDWFFCEDKKEKNLEILAKNQKKNFFYQFMRELGNAPKTIIDVKLKNMKYESEKYFNVNQWKLNENSTQIILD